MLNAAYETRYLEAAFDALPRYLSADALYWPLNIEPPQRNMPPYPQLTPGNVLLSLRRLQALGQDTAWQQQLDALRASWGAHWRQKATQEVHARLRQWRFYLQEDDRAPYYHYKVRERVILALLEEDLGELPSAAAQTLAQLDEAVRHAFVPGAFIWEAPLQRVFPRPTYWFLYGSLQR